jgi:hypothetical protein
MQGSRFTEELMVAAVSQTRSLEGELEGAQEPVGSAGGCSGCEAA